MILRGVAKSIGPGGGRWYARTGLGVGSLRAAIDEGGGGGVLRHLGELSAPSRGDSGGDLFRIDVVFSDIAGVGGRGFLGGGTIGGGNFPNSAFVGEAVVKDGKPADLSSSALVITGSASSYKAIPWW